MSAASLAGRGYRLITRRKTTGICPVNRDSDFWKNVADRDYNAAMQRRKEVPPAVQLEGLRKARDYYVALADQIRDAALESGETPASHRKREQDARRVAAAYENSFNTQNALLNGGRKKA
jgi:hypothetical protein